MSRTVLLLAVAVGCAVSLVRVAPPASAATLTNSTWSSSKTTTSATSASYTYGFTPATSSSLTSVTMTVPTGTGGTPAVGAVSPGALAGGSIALAGTTLTYTFTAASITAGSTISIQVTGLTNTGTAGSYSSQLSTYNGAAAVDTGTSGTVILTASALVSPTWSASSLAAGATSTSYTYTFTTPSLLTVITSITLTVPPGTTGTPTVGTVSPSGILGGSVALSGTTLTYSGLSLALVGTAVSIQVNGLTNTATPGSYTSEIVTNSILGPVSSGVTSAVSFAGALTLTSPGTLSWAATLTGNNQSVADAVAGDQQLAVSDTTGSGAGWHVTVSATTFSHGAATLSNTGTFVLSGGLSSVTSGTAPSASCVTTCTLPSDLTTYPVAIATAVSSPLPADVYDTAAASGLGAITLGGHSAANPVGWWVNVPASALAGAYTSTVTVSIVSGP